MSEPKWTPGPWEAREGDFYAPFAVYGPQDEFGHYYAIASLPGPASSVTCNAQAHLIAAAPELYEALSAAMKFIELSPGDPDVFPDQWEAWKKYVDSNPSQALAKARGET